MKKKSTLALALLLAASFVVMTSCSSTPAASSSAPASSASSEASSAASSAAPVSFTIANFIAENIDQLGTADIQYQKDHPNVKITYEVMDHTTYQQKITTMVQSNTLPDVFWWNGTTLVSALDSTPNAMIDLTPYITGDFLSSFSANAFANLTTPDGKITSFPTEEQIQGFWYNPDVLTKSGISSYPHTYDELIKDVPMITKAGYTVFEQGTKDNWPTWVWELWDEKYGIVDQASAIFKDKTVKMADADCTKVFSDLCQLRTLGAFPKTASSINFDQMEADFIAGKAAFLQLSSDQLAAFAGKPLADTMLFTYDPIFSDSKYEQNIGVKQVGNGFGLGTSAKSSPDKLNAILDFMKWHYSADGVKLALDNGFVMAVKAQPDTSSYGHILQQIVAALNNDAKPMNQSYIYIVNASGNPDNLSDWFTVEGDLFNGCVDGSITASQLPSYYAKMQTAIDKMKPAA